MSGNTNAPTIRTTSWAAHRALVLVLATAACGNPASAPTTPKVDLVRTVSFDELCNWKYTDGFAGMPESVKALDGKRIEITGYLCAIDDREWFLAHLGHYDRAHCDAPSTNEMVVVTPPKDMKDPPGWHIKVVGTFDVKCVSVDGFCIQIYGLRAESVAIVD
jgi:hypothetical protein